MKYRDYVPKNGISSPVKVTKHKTLIGLLGKVICGSGGSFHRSLEVMKHLLIEPNILGYTPLRQWSLLHLQVLVLWLQKAAGTVWKPDNTMQK